MIKSFRHKGLAELFETGRSKRVRPDLWQRCVIRLDALNVARALENLRLPGFGLHKLHDVPARYSIRVNGPWRITFEWEKGNVFRVDLEQYH